MTDDPYRNTPEHKVLQILSFGDHQVANLATEVQARTIGSRLRTPAVDPGRHADADPYFGIPRIRRFPYEATRAGGLGHRPAAPAGLRRARRAGVPRARPRRPRPTCRRASAWTPTTW